MNHNPIVTTNMADGYRHWSNVHIVRGVAKRAIRVVLSGYRACQGDTELIIRAAKVAAKKGWKTVFVELDQYGYGAYWARNNDQYFFGCQKGDPQSSYVVVGHVDHE